MTDAMHQPHAPPTSDSRIVLFTCGVFVILSAWMAVASHGFLEADGVTHYLARRFAFHDPLHLVGVWTRPLCVLIYAIPAQYGIVATRLTSLVLVMLMLAVTLSVNRRQNLARPALVAVFLLTQPLLFAHSFAELTEIPFALLLIGAFWAYQREQFWLLALLAAVAPLARPEGFGLLLVTTLALVEHRRWACLCILPAGLIVWSWTGWHVHGRPSEYPWYRWLPVNWPYSGQSVYGSGSVFRFLLILPAVVGPMAFPLAWIGAWRVVAEGSIGRFVRDSAYRCSALVAIIPIGILLAHSLLWLLGKMASSGEPRYMLIASPFWALLAAAGWEWVCRRLRIAHPIRWTLLAAVMPVVANIVHPLFPLVPDADARLARDIRVWLSDNPELRATHPRLASASPYVFLELDLDRLDSSRTVESSARTVAAAPDGVLLVWDSYFSDLNADASLVITEDLLQSHGWVAIAHFGSPTSTRRATVYVPPGDRHAPVASTQAATRIAD